MRTIGVVCCFFGPWPRWADLFIESCRYNPSIDVYLVTDRATPRHPFPGNVKLVELDLAGFRKLAMERLGCEVVIEDPYKVVDFKPAFGIIFREYLEGYDFWGYCDLDLVFGDVRKFLTEELLEQYDVIATRKEFVTGHFTLYRNAERTNRLYESSRDYRKVFGDRRAFSFDECGFSLHLRLLRGEEFADIASEAEVECLMHVLERSPDVRVHRKTICDEYLPFKESFASILKAVRWEKGRIFDVPTRRELIYYHLQLLKRSPEFYVPLWKEMPEAFLITRKGVYWVGEEGLVRWLGTAIRRKVHVIRRLAPIGLRRARWHLRRLAGLQPQT